MNTPHEPTDTVPPTEGIQGMYESFFGLHQRPFEVAPRVDRYFPAAAIEAARDTLSRTIERAEGIGLVIGPAGCGKTLLLNVLAKQYAERFTVASLGGLKLTTPRALLQAILFEAGLPYRRMQEGELRLALLDHLRPSEKCPDGLLLLFDECHTLPPKLLEELRLLTNVVRDGQPRVRLVLAGGSIMEERFAQPRMQPFQQRITARCYLEAFARTETLGYIQSQLAATGGEWSEVMSDGALSAVHQASDGVPRVVNQICDHALVMAAAGGTRPIEAVGIEEAWADLQQLPLPWNAPQEDEEATSSPIEFGTLDDDDADWQADATSGEGSSEEVRQQGPRPPHGDWNAVDFDDDALADSSVPPERAEEDADVVERPEPSEQLDQIERHLAEVDRDFYPPAGHEPEIVIEVPTASLETSSEVIAVDGESLGSPAAQVDTAPPIAEDPFAEDQFDEEEVVINPTPSVDPSLLIDLPEKSPHDTTGNATETPSTVPFMVEHCEEQAVATPSKTELEATHEEIASGATETADDDASSYCAKVLYDDVVLPPFDYSNADQAEKEDFQPEDDPVLPEDRFEQQAVAPVVEPSVPTSDEVADWDHDDSEHAAHEHNNSEHEDHDEQTTLPLHSFVEQASDGDMIIIEDESGEGDFIATGPARSDAEVAGSLDDDPHGSFEETLAAQPLVPTAERKPAPEVAPRPVPQETPRQQEYRNLFARLRRGE